MKETAFYINDLKINKNENKEKIKSTGTSKETSTSGVKFGGIVG